MDINNFSLANMKIYHHGRMNLMVGLCKQLKLPEIFNIYLEKTLGRKTDISYGVMAEIMIDDHMHHYIC